MSLQIFSFTIFYSSSSFASAITDSVVNIKEDTDFAFSKAEHVTLVGSIIQAPNPQSTIFSIISMVTFALKYILDDDPRISTGIENDLTQWF